MSDKTRDQMVTDLKPVIVASTPGLSGKERDVALECIEGVAAADLKPVAGQQTTRKCPRCGKQVGPGAHTCVDQQAKRTPKAGDVYECGHHNPKQRTRCIVSRTTKFEGGGGVYYHRPIANEPEQASHLSEFIDTWHYIGNALECVELCASLGPDPAGRFKELLDAEKCLARDTTRLSRVPLLEKLEMEDRLKRELALVLDGRHAAEQRNAALVKALREFCNELSLGSTVEDEHDTPTSFPGIVRRIGLILAAHAAGQGEAKEPSDD